MIDTRSNRCTPAEDDTFRKMAEANIRPELIAEELNRSVVLTTKERRPVFRTIEGWARSVLLDAGAIRECVDHSFVMRPIRTRGATRAELLQLIPLKCNAGRKPSL